MIKHFSLFSGIESFKKAMTNLGVENELVGFSEFDKYATTALCSIHGVEESLNFGDITQIDETKVPDCDLITYGFPCQDISVAGLGKGIIEGETRSGLLHDALRIIKHKKPKYAIAENVKNLVGKKFRPDFDNLLLELESYGYNNYWQVLNSKDYGIPQNRERVFVVSIRKDIDNGSFEFPKGFDNGLRLKDVLLDEVEEKYYIDNDRTSNLLSNLREKDLPKIVASRGRNPNNPSDRTVGSPTEQRLEPNNQGITNTLTTVQKDNLVLEPIVCEQRADEGLRFFKNDVIGTIRTIDSDGYKRVLEPNNLKLFTNLSGGKWDKIHESARRVYDEDGIAPTIPTCGGGNIEPKVAVKEVTMVSKENFGRMGRQAVETFNENDLEYTDTINPFNKSTNKTGICPTMTTRPEGFKTAILPVTQDYRIRKLTPNECFRLMGFADEDYLKAKAALEDKFYNGKDRSNSQMYKMAGNSIVVDVLECILESIFKQMI